MRAQIMGKLDQSKNASYKSEKKKKLPHFSKYTVEAKML